MPCYLEAKVSLLVVSFFSLKTMSIRALLRTCNIRFFRSETARFSIHKRADVRHFVFTELISVCQRFILSISTMDVVCTGNADNMSLVYIFSLV